MRLTPAPRWIRLTAGGAAAVLAYRSGRGPRQWAPLLALLGVGAATDLHQWRGRRADGPGDELLMLRAVCHELRPPVNTIGSLMRALNSAPVRDRAAVTRLAAEHATHAEAVLRQAAAAAHDPADAALVPLHRLVPAVAATVPPHRLAVHVEPAAADVEVHPQHVRQILINLLGNAVRHGPAGGRVRLHARTAGRRLHLSVQDEGAPSPDLDVALRRRTPPRDTKGLGLWVVRHLVAAEHGTLRARRRARGLTVEVTLPRRRH
jgi:signal transduction histidine kinase